MTFCRASGKAFRRCSAERRLDRLPIPLFLSPCCFSPNLGLDRDERSVFIRGLAHRLRVVRLRALCLRDAIADGNRGRAPRAAGNALAAEFWVEAFCPEPAGTNPGNARACTSRRE